MNIFSLPSEQIESLLLTLSDVIIVLSAEGVVLDITASGKELQRLNLKDWQGKTLSSQATLDSQDKLRNLLVKPEKNTVSAWRHVNLTVGEIDVPLQLLAIPQVGTDKFWVFGRDLSGVSQMQRRLVESHQSMERDYLRLRHMEARYRLLFETVTDPVLVVDVAQRRVMEANQSAQLVFKDSVKRLPGADIVQCFEPASREAIESLLRAAQASGRMESARVRSLKADQDCQLHASVFMQEGGQQYLLRMQAAAVSANVQASESDGEWFQHALENAPIGFVVTDRSGAVLAANTEICSMLGLSATGQLIEKNLEDFMARGSVDLGVLLNNLRQSGILRGFATELRSSVGVLMPVDVAGVTLTGDQPTYGFFIRDIQVGRSVHKSATSGMADSVEQLSQLVGRMPMKDIVGETSTMIERMCIQAALELTHNNRASAAEMLGLSRQSLYVKLHRYGIVSETDSE